MTFYFIHNISLLFAIEKNYLKKNAKSYLFNPVLLLKKSIKLNKVHCK